jgi:hypothetical protein
MAPAAELTPKPEKVRVIRPVSQSINGLLITAHNAAEWSSLEFGCEGASMSLAKFLRLVAPVCVLTVVAACSGAGLPTDGAASTAIGQPSVPGQPRKTDAPNVPTAPLSIPSTNAWQGNPIDEVRHRVERLVRTECANGELCITVSVAMGDNDSYDQCQFASTLPDTSDAITLKPGSTLTLLTGTWPCETSSSTEPEPTESEPQPTESTPAPTATQTVTNVRPSG